MTFMTGIHRQSLSSLLWPAWLLPSVRLNFRRQSWLSFSTHCRSLLSFLDQLFTWVRFPNRGFVRNAEKRNIAPSGFLDFQRIDVYSTTLSTRYVLPVEVKSKTCLFFTRPRIFEIFFREFKHALTWVPQTIILYLYLNETVMFSLKNLSKWIQFFT